MSRRYSRRGPDFFTILVLLAAFGFGMTLAIQVTVMDREQVVDSETVQVLPNAG